ncbi:MAG TPA: aldehyde dehydrogenase family protein, partial [Xanthomonadaceae bacterium]|nr:aldehyde dehydrogenase family protein [Xanthomonadaceae bacterium]
MTSSASAASATLRLPDHRTLYYGGAWHEPCSGRFDETLNPSTGQPLARVAVGNAADVDAAVAAAARGFAEWRATLPLERGRILRRMA